MIMKNCLRRQLYTRWYYYYTQYEDAEFSPFESHFPVRNDYRQRLRVFMNHC